MQYLADICNYSLVLVVGGHTKLAWKVKQSFILF